jgi:glycine oxidase
LNTSDILIIGAGVIGLSIARELRKRGFSNIRILERGLIGYEASWAAAGILAPQVEADAYDDFFELCYESNRMYDRFAAELFDETGVDIELDSSGVLYIAFDDRDSREFDARFAWQKAAGLKVERLPAVETLEIEPFVSPRVRESLLFPDDRQVENRKLVEALSQFARLNSVEIGENKNIRGILTEGNRVVGVRTNNGDYIAGKVVVATGAWTSLIELGESALPIEVKPIRGQIISFRPSGHLFKHVLYSRKGYLVPRADGRLLAGATVEDVGFDKSTTDEGISRLKEIATEIAPSLRDLDVSDKWAGLRPMTSDGRPFIGPVPGVEGLFIATGHYRNGILLTPITARLIVDEIIGDQSGKFIERFGAVARS